MSGETAGSIERLGRDAPVALVTGGARRVGLAIVLELARAGCDVLIHYNGSAAKASEAAGEVERLGRRAATWRADLEDVEGVEARAREIAAKLARLDVLVHNASKYAPTPLESVTAEDCLSNYAINALSPLLLTKAFASLLRGSRLAGGGAVVAMVDIHAMGLPRREFAAYAMSKAALHEMVRTLARELAPSVRVNGIAPGVVAWPEQGYESDDAAQRAYMKRVPLGRAGTPEDAAGTVRWLALDATYVTGHVVRLDGGRSLL